MGSGDDLVLHYLLATFQIAGHGTLLACVWKWGKDSISVVFLSLRKVPIGLGNRGRD